MYITESGGPLSLSGKILMLITLVALYGLLPLPVCIQASPSNHTGSESLQLEENGSSTLESSCSLMGFQSMAEAVTGYNVESLSKYEHILSKIDSCINSVPQGEDLIDLKELRNQLLYKVGLIQLSIGNDLRAIDAFEQVDDLGASYYYYNLSSSRLSSLYIEFGYWEKLGQLDPQNEELDLFRYLNRTLFEKFRGIKLEDLPELHDELTTMLNIAPYDLQILSLKVDYLFERLINEKHFNDPTLAYEIIKTYETVLEKFKSSSLNISQRIRMHRSIAILQLLVLNSDPSPHLRKCLTLNMDDKLCKSMSLLVSRLNKINPPRRLLLDPESYANGDSLDHIDWGKIDEYYLRKKQNQDDGEKTIPNYKLILQQLNDLVSENKGMFLSERPLLTDLLPLSNDIHLDTIHNFEFSRYIDVTLCQANIEQSLQTKDKSKRREFKQNMKKYCGRTLKGILDGEQWDNFKKITKDRDVTLPDGELEAIWSSYPTVAMYLIDSLISGKNFKHSVRLQQQLLRFIQDENLNSSENKYIKRLVTRLQKVANRRRVEKDRINFQRHQQQQQRQWNFQRGFQQGFNGFQFRNFRQGGAGSQQSYQPPSSPSVDKDYYKVLGVPLDASSKDIRKAYLNLTKKYHPDKQGQLSEDEKKKVHEKMSEINEAYEVLSDEGKKNEYDRARGGRGANFNFHKRGNPFPF